MTAFLMTRRGAMLAAAATMGGCALGRGLASPPDLFLKGREIYSESVQLSGASPDGSTIFSIRLCQYPDAGVAWVWASLLTPGGSYLFADNTVPWSGEASFRNDALAAEYAASLPGMQIRFTRQGLHGAITEGRLEFSKSGKDAFTVSAVFRKASGFAGLLEGRSEMFGNVAAVISAGGSNYKLSGPGQWHEQPQKTPRFTVPFVYASFWGDAVSGTILQSPEGSGGYALKAGEAPEIFNTVSFEPPGPHRLLSLGREQGAGTDLKLETLHAYSLPIYGEIWKGSFVRSTFLGEPVVGFVNNWQM